MRILRLTSPNTDHFGNEAPAAWLALNYIVCHGPSFADTLGRRPSASFVVDTPTGRFQPYLTRQRPLCRVANLKPPTNTLGQSLLYKKALQGPAVCIDRLGNIPATPRPKTLRVFMLRTRAGALFSRGAA